VRAESLEDEEMADRIVFAARTLAPGDNEAAWYERVDWMRAIVQWSAETPDGSRLLLVARNLEARPEAAEHVRSVLRGLLDGGDALRFLADAGVPRRRSLADEAMARIIRTVVPRVGESRDLVDVLEFVVGDRKGLERLVSAPEPALAAFVAAMGGTDAKCWSVARRQLAEATYLHAIRCADIGLADDVRRPLGRVSVYDSPFTRLTVAATRLLNAVAAPGQGPEDVAEAASARDAVEAAAIEARTDRERISAHLETAGVDGDLVLRLDIFTKSLDRIEAALPVLAPRAGENASVAVARLLRAVAHDLAVDAQLSRLFRDRSRLLARRIAERSGDAGSHYITADGPEWRNMVRMGLGGGVVIGFAVWVKSSIYALHLAPLTSTILVCIDYAAAFLLIHAAHWTLATKQPPMTAAAFAGALMVYSRERVMQPLVELIARISRSQVAGLVGNVVATAAIAALLDVGWWLSTGRHILDVHAAEVAIASHAPFGSGTIFYAIVTGFAVWLSSMVAGWTANAAHYARLEESLAPKGPLHRRVRGGWMTAWLVRNVGAVAGNVSLAVFLVGIPFLGKSLGIPLDVRHVTMSTGHVVLGIMGADAPAMRDVAWACVGVGVIGVLNILTGFAFSLAVALRVRGEDLRAQWGMVFEILRSPVGNPLRFFVPVDSGPPAKPPASH
jgi:site-specific recombinase